MHEYVLKFFGALFNISNTYFKHPGGQAQSNDHDTEIIYLSRRRKMVALFQTLHMLSIIDTRERQCIS